MNTIIFSIYTNTEMLVIFISRKTMFCFKKYNTESKKTHPKLNNKNKKLNILKKTLKYRHTCITLTILFLVDDLL
jgi:hypothetical protein